MPKAPKAILNQLNTEVAKALKKLPAGTDVTRHWSGKRNLQQAMQALRGDVMYATLYRHTSSISHASDFGAHFEAEPASGEFVWQLEPQVRGFEAPSYAARELLWAAANRIDERLGLGFAATLAPHKLMRADVEKGQR